MPSISYSSLQYWSLAIQIQPTHYKINNFTFITVIKKIKILNLIIEGVKVA